MPGWPARLTTAVALVALVLALGASTEATARDAGGDPPPSLAVAAPDGVAAARVLGQVGDVTVVSYPPRGFERLRAAERVLAYHLTAAALAGDRLFTRQTSRYALAAQELVRRMLAASAPLEPALRAPLHQYRQMLFLHHGLHDKWRSIKVRPPLGRAEFERALRATGTSAPADLLAAMFDPDVLPMLVDKTPAPGHDAIASSAATHYEGLTSRDLQGYEEQFPLNGRLVKRDGRIVEEVYRAGDARTPPGVGAAELARVVAHVEAAARLAAPRERRALTLLAAYLRTGDNRLFRAHDIAWLGQVFPVDYIFGFIETYTDVRLRKGSFEGFVATRDPAHDPPLQALARQAAYFEGRLPWPAKYRRSVPHPPASAAVAVLAATGDGGPFTFGGVNLPNPQDLRQRYGTKNFITASVVDARLEIEGTKFIDEFAPEEVRAELRRCAGSVPYVSIGFHEVTGHGSGRVSPTLRADPSILLAPYFLTLEEGRADLVADYLSGDPMAVRIGLVPDQGCARAFPAAKMLRLLRNFLEVPLGDRAEEDHLRAGLIELGVLRERGVITVERRGGKTFFVVADPDAWRRVVGELLAEHQRIKATGDAAALAALVERYGTRLDTALRDEIVARSRSLALPEYLATIPPLITPVRDTAGRVVDARAEQVTSLDAYIEAVEAAGGALLPAP